MGDRVNTVILPFFLCIKLGGGEKMKKKLFTLVLLSFFVALMALPACSAVVTPVEVEQVKDVCFIRMKGDHNSESFVFHYVNLSPHTQRVKLTGAYGLPGGLWAQWSPPEFIVPSGDSIEATRSAHYGHVLDFTVSTRPNELLESWNVILEESVVIPPKQ